ncbi:MAG: propionyl-CoA synthetase [Gammaproteobacteria bacterium]|nr:propionyl-CoA synthetase [Gammaproteobacteria bacterium]
MPDNWEDDYRRSLADPEQFWTAAAGGIDWHGAWNTVLDTSESPVGRWFTGATLNTCHNAVDRHVVAGRGEQPALIYDSAMTGTTRILDFAGLQNEVARFAGALARFGVSRGDRVIIYMPMVPEAAIAMLACARLGAVHSVVFGGFAARELATRIDDAQPKLILAASCGLEPGRVVEYKPLLDEAIALASHQPDACIILQREQHPASMGPRDHDWQSEASTAEPADCVPVAATDPLYILYTSGTTGQPKGIVRDNGGHAVALHWSMQAIYGVDVGDVFWAASDVGWVVGHSYIVYGPLLRGCATVMFEGKPVGTPDAGTFWRVIAEHGVKAMFTAPTAFRAIRREDSAGALLKDYDLAHFDTLFLAGERCDPETLQWAREQLQVPVIDHWWQTETGWAIAANPVGLGRFEIRPGSAGKPMPGWDVRFLDDGGQPVSDGETGAIACRLPLPPGALPTLWNAPERFRQSYLERFPGYYQTGDAGYCDTDGYVYVMSRTDDVINVAGHRLSTGAIEEVLAAHPDVAECAVTGIRDGVKGQVPLGFLCLKADSRRPHADVSAEAVDLVRERIGPVAAFKQALVVKRLPKTRSGKVLRGTMRRMADGEPYTTPATIDDPAILDEIAAALATINLPAGIMRPG